MWSENTMLDALSAVLMLCALRGLPFAVLALWGARSSVGRRLASLLLYATIVGASGWLRGAAPLLWALAGYGYYALCACAVPRLARAVRERRMTLSALFIGLASVYLIAPTVFLLRAQYLPFLVLGWELLLSSYSYCHDQAGRSDPLVLGPCLFFLLVDPTLTHAHRARPLDAAVGRTGRGAGRISLGVAALLLANAVLRPGYAAVLDAQHRLPALHTALAFGVLRFLSEYAAHSGLASIQIGLMRQHGHGVDERYVRPWLARDPLDFWRRWNTYVGRWLRQYVFVPLSRRAGTRMPRELRNVLVTLGTLLASGLLHDGYGYLAVFGDAAKFTQLFCASGLMIALWSIVGSVRGALGRAAPGALVGTAVSRVGLGGALIAAALVWG